MGSNEILPYWNINVPESERTLTCPEALLHLSEKDLHIISTPNKDFQRQTWARVQDLVRSNHLESLQRVPSELRRYRIFTYNIAKQFGSVANFILSQRLQWEAPVQLRSRPFENPDDIKILYNDWPYGIDPRIVHLVVWTKFSLQNDPATGDLTDSARDEIASFVSDNFLRHMPEDKLIWFKNWASLKSINSVEHFHIMLFDPDPEFLRVITRGDVPQCEQPSI